MSFLVEYVQPLTHWLQHNPNWSLLIAFLVSLAESLAIVGSIIPGSLTMTAIGILAGSGIMRIDLTLLSAIAGAVCGDSLSYLIGYCYSEQLTEVWPFRRYPSLFDYGKVFFNRHGGKSVLFGRFVGPLRSIIPVVAGVLHMKQWHFFVVNIVSGVLWAFLYVGPGILIGAASSELSAEGATRLIMVLLILLFGASLLSVFLKWFLSQLNYLLRRHLHNIWLGLKEHPILYRFVQFLTPSEEKNHYPTALLLIGTTLFFILFIVLVLLSVHVDWYVHYNTPFYLLIQSFRSKTWDTFFILSSQVCSSFTLYTVFIFSVLFLAWSGNYLVVRYLISVILISTIIGICFASLLSTPHPQDLLVTLTASSFPAFNLQIATAFYGFMLFYIISRYDLLTNLLKSTFFALLGLSGLAQIYFGDYWLSDVLAAYSAGAVVCFIHCLLFRKEQALVEKSGKTTLMVLLTLIVLLGASFLSSYLNYKVLLRNHSPYHKEYTLSRSNWWNQQAAVLPLYVLNRIGTPISLLNLQYDGNLEILERTLEEFGWKSHRESLLARIMQRFNKQSGQIKLPLLDFLFNNKHPELIMTYSKPGSNLVLELRIWESNYFLAETKNPIYIGSVHRSRHANPTLIDNKTSIPDLTDPLAFITPALSHFTLRRIELTHSPIKPTLIPTLPYLLLIKQAQRI